VISLNNIFYEMIFKVVGTDKDDTEVDRCMADRAQLLTFCQHSFLHYPDPFGTGFIMDFLTWSLRVGLSYSSHSRPESFTYFCRLLKKLYIVIADDYNKVKFYGGDPIYSYEKLEKKLADKGINRTDLTHEPGISSRTIAKISKGEKLSQRTLRKIAEYLSCDPDDLFQIISDNPILQRLREEKEARLPGGLYHELQIRMTYNSNHMEGSILSEEQTRLIFETNTVDAGNGIPIDDILETVHHFRAIDYVIDHAEERLSEDFIKELHFIIKHDTKDASFPWFAVGDYKKRANVVGGRKTARPQDVSVRMKELLAAYNAKKEVSVLDIIKFHSDFEHIHPFQDGNGRVGRLIALKECFHWNIIPFIIEDSKKTFYYRGLSEWENEKGYLTDTCLDGQDTFRKLLDLFEFRTS